jgi:hypothetical protein
MNDTSGSDRLPAAGGSSPGAPRSVDKTVVFVVIFVDRHNLGVNVNKCGILWDNMKF